METSVNGVVTSARITVQSSGPNNTLFILFDIKRKMTATVARKTRTTAADKDLLIKGLSSKAIFDLVKGRRKEGTWRKVGIHLKSRELPSFKAFLKMCSQ
jgi:hypothetical protein